MSDRCIAALGRGFNVPNLGAKFDGCGIIKYVVWGYCIGETAYGTNQKGGSLPNLNDLMDVESNTLYDKGLTKHIIYRAQYPQIMSTYP